MMSYTETMLKKIVAAKSVKEARALAECILTYGQMRKDRADRARAQAELVDMTIEGYGNSLIECIKHIRTHTGMGLKEAADIARERRKTTFTALTPDAAKVFIADLVGAGCRCTTKEHRPARKAPVRT